MFINSKAKVREKEINLWSMKDPLPFWEYRKEEKREDQIGDIIMNAIRLKKLMELLRYPIQASRNYSSILSRILKHLIP